MKFQINALIYTATTCIKNTSDPLFDMDKSNNKSTVPGIIEHKIQSSGL